MGGFAARQPLAFHTHAKPWARPPLTGRCIMKIPSFSKGGEVGFNMTPMIDVVFQLIIFFLVSSHLAKQEIQFKLPLPEARSGQKDKPTEKPRLTVNVLADGTLLFAGRQVTAEELQVHVAS